MISLLFQKYWIIERSKISICVFLFLVFALRFPSSAYASIVINEVLPNPVGTDKDLEWLELYNDSGDTVSLEGYILKYVKDTTEKEMTLDGGIDNYRVIYPHGEIPLTNSGTITFMLYESLEGIDPIDTFVYTDSSEGESWGRLPDGGDISSEKLLPSEGSSNQPLPTPTPTPTPKPTKTPKPSASSRSSTPKPTSKTLATTTPTSTVDTLGSNLPSDEFDDDILATKTSAISHKLYFEEKGTQESSPSVLGITKNDINSTPFFFIAGGSSIIAAAGLVIRAIRKGKLGVV